MIVPYAWRLVMRNPHRSAAYLFGLALAVGLLAGILFFIDATAREMTTTTLAPVKLDMVVHGTKADVAVTTMAGVIAGQRGINAAEAVIAADFASAVKVGGTQPSPPGRLFAIQPTYFDHFTLVELSQGTLAPDGVLISEAMAIAQGVAIGDAVQLTFTGIASPVTLPVTGIVNMENAYALFTTAIEAENAIVADVVFVDSTWFQQHLLPPLVTRALDPLVTPLPGAVILDPQVHVKLDRALLPGDPALAALHTASLRREVERQFPAQLKAMDNLSNALKVAQADVLSAKMLFIFLGLPGVALAAYLAKFAAELFAEAQRREVSLLRTRGATPGQITGVIAVTAFLLAIGGACFGLLFGLVILMVSARGPLADTLNPFTAGFAWGAFGNSAGIAVLAGLLLTFFAAFIPTFVAMRREITQERRIVQRHNPPPFWKRAWLDGVALVIAAVVLAVTWYNGGFKPTGNEGQAVQLSFYIFLAPFFAWLGVTLLTLRLVEAILQRTTPQLAAGFRRLFGDIGEVAGKSVSRRAARISAATAVIALTLSFGVSLTLFQHTYALEKQLDAQYVVGADIRFTPALNTAQTADFADQLYMPGVVGVTGVARDPMALIGWEKNTVYGIDVPSFRQVAYLPDSFFVDGAAERTINAMRDRTRDFAPGSAQQVLDALAQTPNGVIISVEQAEKYNILVGDPLLLRLFNRQTGAYRDVQAQTVGLFTYFPTSALDSDFILNRDFMLTSSGSPVMDYFLLKTTGDLGTIQRVTAQLKALYQSTMPVRIENTETVVKIEMSSLSSLNLDGLGAMERLYTLFVASIGLAIFLLTMINERRREFGAMRALGANLSHLRRFLLTEAATIGGLSLLIGGLVGVGLAHLLVMLLSVIFTIPAQGVAWPVLDLLLLALLTLAGMTVSTFLSARQLATLKVVESLREL